MHLSKKSSTALLIVAVCLVLLVVAYFPVFKAGAKFLGFITTDRTVKSYEELDKLIKEVGQKGPGTTRGTFLTIDEDSAIMGFSAVSQKVEIIRTGFDFEFPKPAECGGSSCLCVCKKVMQDPVLGYYCKRPAAGETKRYLECDKELGIDIINELKEEEFEGSSTAAEYGVKGGFLIGRFTTNVVTSAGEGGGLEKSRVFNVPENTAVYVQKGSGNFLAVCLNKDGCISAEREADQIRLANALELYSNAKNEFAKNTPEGYEKAKEYYDQLLNNETLVEVLKRADPSKLNEAYFFRASVLEKQGKDDEAISEYADIPSKLVGDFNEITEWTKRAEENRCKLLEKKGEQCQVSP